MLDGLLVAQGFNGSTLCVSVNYLQHQRSVERKLRIKRKKQINGIVSGLLSFCLVRKKLLVNSDIVYIKRNLKNT